MRRLPTNSASAGKVTPARVERKGLKSGQATEYDASYVVFDNDTRLMGRK
jgi:hypothetical protein